MNHKFPKSVSIAQNTSYASHPLTQAPQDAFDRHRAIKECFYADDWDEYAYGYKCAANYLIDDILHGQARWENVIVPLCYLERHYVELELKAFLMLYCALHNLHLPKKRLLEHKLSLLWQKAKTYYINLGLDMSLLKDSERSLLELEQVEVKPDGFKYPVATDFKTKSLLTGDYRHLNQSSTCLALQNCFSLIEIIKFESWKALIPEYNDPLADMRERNEIVAKAREEMQAFLDALPRS